MSVCGQTGASEDDTASEDLGASARDAYKDKPASKIVRVFTVLAYLLLVSLGAILLSVYYVCVWKSPELPLMNATEYQLGAVNARTGKLSDYGGVDYRLGDGGGNITVNGSAILSPNTTAVSAESTDAALPTDIATEYTSESSDVTMDGQPDSTLEPSSSYGDTDSIT